MSRGRKEDVRGLDVAVPPARPHREQAREPSAVCRAIHSAAGGSSTPPRRGIGLQRLPFQPGHDQEPRRSLSCDSRTAIKCGCRTSRPTRASRASISTASGSSCRSARSIFKAYADACCLRRLPAAR